MYSTRRNVSSLQSKSLFSFSGLCKVLAIVVVQSALSPLSPHLGKRNTDALQIDGYVWRWQKGERTEFGELKRKDLRRKCQFRSVQDENNREALTESDGVVDGFVVRARPEGRTGGFIVCEDGRTLVPPYAAETPSSSVSRALKERQGNLRRRGSKIGDASKDRRVGKGGKEEKKAKTYKHKHKHPGTRP
jgi:hypothetical protein